MSVIDYTGGTNVTGVAGSSWVAAFPITLTIDGSVSSIGVHIKGSQVANIRVALYSNGVGNPASLLSESISTAAIITDDWQDVTIPSVEVIAGTYWVIAQFDASKTVYYNYSSRSYYAKTYGAFDSSWSGSSTQDSNAQWHMRVTITEPAPPIGGEPIGYPSTVIHNLGSLINGQSPIQSNDINDLRRYIEAIEAKIGIDSSIDTTSLDYKINQLSGKNLKGFCQRSPLNGNYTGPTISIGPGIYHIYGTAEKFVYWDSTLTIDNTEDGFGKWVSAYVYIDYDTITTNLLTASNFYASQTDIPSWSNSKHGWYYGNDRCIGYISSEWINTLLDYGGKFITVVSGYSLSGGDPLEYNLSGSSGNHVYSLAGTVLPIYARRVRLSFYLLEQSSFPVEFYLNSGDDTNHSIYAMLIGNSSFRRTITVDVVLNSDQEFEYILSASIDDIQAHLRGYYLPTTIV